jgi:subtilisin family serine protease
LKWPAIIALLIFSSLIVPRAYAQAGAGCDVVACQNEPAKPPKVFDLQIILRPAPIKPKILVPTEPKKKPAAINKPKPKPAAVKKQTKPKPPVKKVVVARKPVIVPPSWEGLSEVPVVRLVAEDFSDIAGQYIVDFNPDAFAAAGLNLLTISHSALATELGLASYQVHAIQRRFLLSATLKATPAQAIGLANNPLIAQVHADTQIKAAGGVQPLSWGLDRLDAPSLPLDGKFDRDFGDYASRIYLFDSGVDRWHDEFEERAKFGSSFVDALPRRSGKCREHGTEMASLINGQTTGSAPKAQVVDLVVLPCTRNQTGEASSLIEAAEWLLIREADFGDGKPAIANMSLAGKWSRKINSAVSVLTKNGVAVVVAAGNNAQDACRFSPAAAKDAITVAATDALDKTPGFSNFGQCVDIHAPGRLLTALTEGQANQYVAVNGTSGAAALVSGLLSRSLKIKGPDAASKWLADAGAPAQYWRKDQPDLLLAQASAKWRQQCRAASLAGGVPMRSRPGPNAAVVQVLKGESLVFVARSANNWAYVSEPKGASGWVYLGAGNQPPLLDPKANSVCKALP